MYFARVQQLQAKLITRPVNNVNPGATLLMKKIAAKPFSVKTRNLLTHALIKLSTFRKKLTRKILENVWNVFGHVDGYNKTTFALVYTTR